MGFFSATTPRTRGMKAMRWLQLPARENELDHKDSNMDSQSLLSIHRHWIWANWIKKQFEGSMQSFSVSKDTIQEWYINPPGTYMCIWYGLLFSICEGLRAHSVHIPEVQSDIDEIYSALKRFRNAVFHIQPKYWSPKLFEIMEKKGSAIQIRKVHDGIGNWLLKQMDQTDKKLPSCQKK